MKKVLAVLFALAFLVSMTSVIAGADESPVVEPEVKYSMDKVTYTKGTKTDTDGTADIPFDKFAGIVIVDGKELEADKDYTAREGSTIITFKGDYLETLAVGSYALEVKAVDGSAVTTLEVVEKQAGQPENPEEPGNGGTPTGDTSHTALWVAISLVSLGCIGLVAFGIKKKTATK